MAPRLETFLQEKILSITQAVVEKNTKKATNFVLSVLTGSYKITFILNYLQQNRKHALENSPKSL